MSTITGQDILDRAWIKAHDSGGAGGVRWPGTEGLLWINDGQREIVNLLPKANAKSSQTSVVAGSRQTLTGLGLTDGMEVLDVVCNVSGSTRGRPITKRERAWFDENLPAWHVTSAAEAYHWTFDERDPEAFYLWPQPTGNKVEIVYAASPTDLANLAATISLDDIYGNALQFFVLFSFYSKDAPYAKSPQVANDYWNKFQSCLGIRERSIVSNDMSGDAKIMGRGG